MRLEERNTLTSHKKKILILDEVRFVLIVKCKLNNKQ